MARATERARLEKGRRELSLQRLRLVVNRRSWCMGPGPRSVDRYSEAVCILAGVFPDESRVVRDDDGYGYRELGFCPLPGLLQVIGFAEPPKSRADHWRMGCAIADRLAEFATLPELGSCQPAVIVKEAMDRGFDLCWRGTALNDPGCARVREWGRSIDGPEKAGDQAPPPPPFIEAQRRKGELRREKEFGNIMLEKIGYPIFLKHEEKIKQGMAFSAVARVIDREIQRSLKESDPDPYDIRAVARRVGAWAEGKRLPKKRPEDD